LRQNGEGWISYKTEQLVDILNSSEALLSFNYESVSHLALAIISGWPIICAAGPATGGQGPLSGAYVTLECQFWPIVERQQMADSASSINVAP